ncbi:histidinol-phosphatase HisJ [Clostridium paraputrificum]|uniref:histidinol-phosphatase HisJ n=1 Tax=Clostridium TaxID=1485 RepID=UPI00232F1BF9|nr:MULTISPECIES: histidinol-phosphatase HisJ [Clostridium]MDB2090539.1 histidinol-phosphatase HisJ [Clostridium paraputrificum]MDB2097154.1 histidinol-phosphatase HisJ [Clostridium paraputrificum]MDU1180360.1 histidinol-phosphatase HisJ [Clostridium sp.]MDU1227551.1 histidinol-phosphatase HisJ [Clostridium sp.]MDU4320280.1 histidinol-phosphatase HisJ [Clostridium sp.]
MKWLKDGHMHSHYCPHGTRDSFQMYVERALEVALDEITFTEHMPLPGIFMDEKLLKECSPNEDEILLYLKEATKIKEEYKDKIKINVGLEVDYVEGYEEKIKLMLDSYGEYLDDGILSVHFLKLDDGYHCLDMSVDEFGNIAKILGGVEKVYDKYFETLIKSINADLGRYKPKRIGHPTLVRIFNEKYPIDYKNEALIDKVIKNIKENGYEIDFNTAGLRKAYCKETYPSGVFLDKAIKNNIKMIKGSDAHSAKDVGKVF